MVVHVPPSTYYVVYTYISHYRSNKVLHSPEALLGEMSDSATLAHKLDCCVLVA